MGNTLKFDPAHPDARPAAQLAGALYGDPLRRAIILSAQRHGIDPNVVLAIVPHEGGFQGAVGDNGSSFGPFQLHVGGALPSGKDKSWAQSPEGIDYAVGQIAKAVGGAKGAQAVSRLVTDFERPASQYVPGEIAKAQQTFAQLSGGSPLDVGPAAAANAATGNFPSLSAGGNPLGGLMGYLMATASTPQQSPDDAISGLMGALMTQNMTSPAAGGTAPGFTSGDVTTLPYDGQALGAQTLPFKGGTPKVDFLDVQSDSSLKGVDPKLVASANQLARYLGKKITVTSGFRSRDEQAKLYQRYLNSGKSIRYIAAAPGTSNHEGGEALDLAINGVPIASAVPADVLARFGLHTPVKGDLPHTTLLSVNG